MSGYHEDEDYDEGIQPCDCDSCNPDDMPEDDDDFYVCAQCGNEVEPGETCSCQQQLITCIVCGHKHWSNKTGYLKCQNCVCKKDPPVHPTISFDTEPCYMCKHPHFSSDTEKYFDCVECSCIKSPSEANKLWTCANCEATNPSGKTCTYCGISITDDDEFDIPADKIAHSSEQSTGVAAGLNIQMRLSRQCANFYVLEALMNHLYPWNGDVRIPQQTYPRNFGSDSAYERLAYSTDRTFKVLVNTLAEEFYKYLVMACGGELRHAKRLARTLRPEYHKEKPKCVHKCTPYGELSAKYPKRLTCCKHHCDLFCCEHKKNCDGGPGCCTHIHKKSPDYNTGLYRLSCTNPKECNCRCEHAHKGLHPGVGNIACKDDIKGCTFQGCEHKCDHTCCKHKCIKKCCTHKPCSGCKEPPKYRPSKHLLPFMSNPDKSRSSAWGEWLKLVAEHGSTILLEASDAFNKYEWRQGYGGLSWGTAAQFVYEYHKGMIPKRSFIDRCWTLQHNGGCIFNKFYLDIRSLTKVLETQATATNYTKTLVPYASPYVRGLWADSERLQIREADQERLFTRLARSHDA